MKTYSPKSLLVSLLLAVLCEAVSAGQPLIVVSIDGLDHRYLGLRDELKLNISTLRKLIREGEWANGMVGVYPSVTWPSHTTMITGVLPAVHGIVGNRRPAKQGGKHYWFARFIKVETLWQAAARAGLKTAAITWPVTAHAQIDYNLPEVFLRRRGGAMDLFSIERLATPGLIDEIARAYPSFLQEWIANRERALAAKYILSAKQPALLLLHFVDHDAAAHANGPFSREAIASLEFIDGLLGLVLDVAPPDAVVAIVSDHGFERVNRIVNVRALLERAWIEAEVHVLGGLVLTRDSVATAFFRDLSVRREGCVGRELSKDEIQRFAPQLSDFQAAFEPDDHCWFGWSESEELYLNVEEPGQHGFWPTRPGYRASFILWGKGIKQRHTPEVSMTDLARRFAGILGIAFEPGAK